MLGLVNITLFILIAVGVIVLVAGYTRGRAVHMIPASLVEKKLSGGKRPFQPHGSVHNLFIASVFYSIPEITPVPLIPMPANLPPEHWMEWPVVPVVSDRTKEIYRAGLASGNNPYAFSLVGDSQSKPHLFMGVYDSGQYQLPAGSRNLQETISHFSGSFSRWGPAVIDGGTSATVLARSWATQKGCGTGELPLECELRIQRPVIVFVNLGTHWTNQNPEYLRQIVQIIIDHGAVPILATKADNLEGNFANNLEMARISMEYDIPLWNFWAVVQGLPHGGLDPTIQGGFMYLTEEGLARRRFSALQVLDAVWRELNEY
jgi:hypothetical protein